MKNIIPELALKRISLICASGLIIIGIYGFIGRLSNFAVFMYETYGILPISIFGSLSYMLIGISLLILSMEKRYHIIWLGKCIIYAVMVFSFIFFFALIMNVELDLQKALLGWAVDEKYLMLSIISPYTTLGIFFGTIGLHLRFLPIYEHRSCQYIIGVLGMIVASIGVISLLGYAYGAPELYGGLPRPASISSSVALIILGIGILSTMRPMDWPVKILFSQQSSHIMIRYLIPLIASSIIITGWVIGVAIPYHQNPLLITAIFVIIAVIFVSILAIQIMGIIDKRINQLQSERDKVIEELKLANEKLRVLGSLTRHDILNQASLARIEAELAKRYQCDPAVGRGLDNIIKITKTIESLLRFQKEYQNIGQEKERWINLKNLLSEVSSKLDFGNVRFEFNGTNLWIFADPMIEKAVYNIVENSLRHGGTVTKISAKAEVGSDGSLTITIEDNGIGIQDTEKERIFEKDVGRNTGLGLFLAREILRYSEMTIKETGKFGKGARFEITVPAQRFKSS